MTPQDAQVALARAALDPEAAMEARELADTSPSELESVAGVLAIERTRVHGITMAVEVDPPPEHSRWRFFVFYQLIRLACWFYPFKFEFYRTRQPWE